MADVIQLAASRPRHAGDVALVRAVLARREGAWAQLLERVGDSLYGLVADVFDDDAGAEYERLLELLRRDDFRLLREYDGRARLDAYLRLCAADLLGTRILARFERDPSAAWRAFERAYRPELMRVIAQCFPEGAGEADVLPGRDDVYQEVSFSLIADGYRRIRAYDGRGRFSAYVRRVTRNLCTDLQRRVLGRLRLPEAVKQRSALEQEAYRLLHWRGLGNDEAVEALSAASDTGVSPERAREAVTTVAGLPAPARAVARAPLLEEPVDERASPEALVLAAESEARVDLDHARLEGAVAALSPEERLYVRLRFYETPPTPPREIARRMGRTPREVYKLRERVMGALRQALGGSGGEESEDVRPSE